VESRWQVKDATDPKAETDTRSVSH